MTTRQAPTTTEVLYRIDRADVLTDVGGAWDEFARANGGIGNVVGRPLWHFVTGADVRAVWSLLLRRARGAERPLAFLYRCDGPGVRRLMQMEMLAEDGSVAFRSTQIKAAAASTYLGRWEQGTSRDAVVVCGWCARVHLETWVAPEAAADELGLTGGRAARLSHGLCETCARELRALGQ
ncbi:MAG TPA: hypothetical protein VGO39_04190 [Gaiellaceae bacterium]|nr:hypothetical protein [Gaiellaceae bacterium]